MMKKAWLLFPLPVLFSGCDKAWDTPHVESDQAGLEAPECDCKAKARADDPSERVDMKTVDLVNAPARGPANAKVTLVVYSDFECPFCKKAMKTVDELSANYPNELRVVFKQRPLPFHEHAELAAKAALVAQKEGKFWEFEKAVFASRTKLDQAELERIAEEVGMNLERFRTALASPELDVALERDLAEAERVGAKGTPTFLVNGKRIPGAQPYEVFADAIDEALR
jgi:protein-disulfide isomerase